MRKVAWVMSKGRIGFIPCTMKKGEWPMNLQVVVLSAALGPENHGC